MQPGDGELTFTARLEEIDARGSAGLMARLDIRDAASAHVRILVDASSRGAFEPRSAVRLETGGSAVDGGGAPVTVELPVTLRIVREAGSIITLFDDGDGLVEHLAVDVSDTDLDATRLKYAMVQSSGSEAESATARFARVELTSDNEPPGEVDCYPTDLVMPIGGDVDFTIHGVNLDFVDAVTVAGERALIVDQSPGSLTIHVPPIESGAPARRGGDIVLATPSREIVLPGAAVSAGRKFIRSDANGDLAVDLSDAVFLLLYLFVGGRELECPEAGE